MTQRRALLRLSNNLLPLFMSGGDHRYTVTGGALPPDARVVDCRMSFGGRDLEMVLESGTFAEVPSGAPYPELAPTFRRVETPEGPTGHPTVTTPAPVLPEPARSHRREFL